uniref:Glucuronosyltransferase n=1 Tax=Meloidogyne javanica TaxID=6303 RepID=A0A915ND75_MELJA
MIVYSKEIGTPIEINPMPNDLKIIEMYIDIKHLDQELIANNRLLKAYNDFKGSMEYVVGIFEVKIGEEYIGILEWILQRNQQQKYSFGIADFTEMAGSFAIFEALGIEKTFNVFPSIILPADFQFFGINIVHEIREGNTVIPAINFAKPGDWRFTQDGGCHFKLERFMRNLKEHKNQINSNKKIYQNAVSKILAKTLKIRRENQKEYFFNLFNKINYHFVNQNSHANFENFPKDDRIVYIGGILVEENEKYLGLATNKYE